MLTHLKLLDIIYSMPCKIIHLNLLMCLRKMIYMKHYFQNHEEVDINLIEKIRIGFYIPQWKLDILQDIYFNTPE